MKLVSLLLFLGFVVAAFMLQSRIPFYASWDMDFITVTDLYRMGDGLLPQHINHTAFGMYLPLRALWYLLPLDVHNLTEWISQPVPLLPVVDAVVWLRYTSILAVTVTLIATWSALPTVGMAVLLVSLPSLWLMHVQTVRTEMWAVMWYALAFAVIPRIRTTKLLLLCLALAGLALVTKYQGVFLHAGLVLILLAKVPREIWPTLPSRRWLKLAMATFLFLSICAFCTYIPSSFAIFSKRTAPNIFFVVAFLVLLLPFFPSVLYKWTNKLWWVGIGIMSVFALHFLVGFNFLSSWEYLLFDWRMLFLRHANPAIAADRADNILLWSLIHHAGLLVLWFSILAYNWKAMAHNQRWFAGLYALLIVASLRLVTRGHIQDAIWNDFLIIFGFLILPLERTRRWAYALPVLALIQIYQLRELPSQTRYAGQYDLDRFWSEPYESPEVLYTEKMSTLVDQREAINGQVLKRR